MVVAAAVTIGGLTWIAALPPKVRVVRVPIPVVTTAPVEPATTPTTVTVEPPVAPPATPRTVVVQAPTPTTTATSSPVPVGCVAYSPALGCIAYGP